MDRLHQPRIFLHELPWDFRSRNTDWRVVRYALPQLRDYEPDLTLTTERSTWVTLAGNAKAIRVAVGWRTGMPLKLYDQLTSRLSERELARSMSNVVYTRLFPLNAGNVPVIWCNAIVDTEMQRNFYHVTEGDLAEEFEVRGKLFRQAEAVHVYSEVERQRHAETFPGVRFVMAPHFTPQTHACELAVLGKHRNAEPVRILFVGNHAVRKGLDQLFDAFLQLPVSIQRRAQLTVISNFDGSNMKIPDHDRIHVLKGAPSDRVMSEMRQAHIFVNVARFESYGLVYREAMSQGVACLAPNWEVQRELFDNGKAGLNLPCDTDAIRQALELLIEDEEYRYTLALAGWNRFQQKYTPEIVANLYAEMFRSVVGR